MKNREIFELVKGNGCDGCVFFDEISCRYLSGFNSTDGAVLVKSDETVLITDMRYYEAVNLQREAGIVPFEVHPILHEDGLYKTVAKFGLKKIAYDPKLLYVHQLDSLKAEMPNAEFVPIPDALLPLRSIKTAEELSYIKTAQKITDAAFSHIVGYIRHGMTELEVASELEHFMRKNGADGNAFDTIAVSGSKSSQPHGVPGDEVLTENSFLTLDFGAKYKGYCSDMTRTVVIGKASDEMKKVYNIVRTSQENAIKKTKAGMTGKQADALARDIIDESGYGEAFSHSLGHSLGLEIHEKPVSATKSESVFVPGNILTVEPGIYLAGRFGCRIEDMIVITENGCEDLTHSTKELLEL